MLQNPSFVDIVKHGRWCHVVIENTGKKSEIVQSDLNDVEIVKSVLYLPEGYRIHEHHYVMEKESGGASEIKTSIFLDAKNRQGVDVPTASQKGTCTIYLFVSKAVI